MEDTRIKKIIDTIRPGKKLLNVGCAQNPEIHYGLAQKCNKITGIDLNEEGIEEMKKAGHNVRLMNAEMIDFDEKFDYIIAGEIIEHLSNPGLFLDSATKHLENNGELIITTPNISSLFLIPLVIVFDKSQDPGHVHYFDLKNLTVLVSRHNLSVESHQFIPPSIKKLGGNVFTEFIFFVSTLLANMGSVFSPRLFGSYIFLVLKKK